MNDSDAGVRALLDELRSQHNHYMLVTSIFVGVTSVGLVALAYLGVVLMVSVG